MSKKGEVVCVTGGSGCIGSWLVRLLLERGYTVHATVKNLKDEKETKHLESLEGANTRLRLYQIDLLDYDSIVTAINGCAGVFHLASPCIVDQVHDPQAYSFNSTIRFPSNAPRFSCQILAVSGKSCTETYQDFFMGSVHFKDVALAHIIVYENPSATGRHLCVEAISHYGDFVAKVAELYPEYKIPRLPMDTQPGLLRTKNGAKKLMDLGLEFIPMEQIIKDAVESLKSQGFIS
ncbi:hypothetical protein OIU77_028621 [Salix suchowensis]|uniref:NAD(P)-binding domain-containing protein n=1 Tax=Salix suchowensis TaxID=1278906 RepID=A0ABQ9BI17_9ROSI|nr:hypothetical protein OIU77_028621 [Salix suchowensis]